MKRKLVERKRGTGKKTRLEWPAIKPKSNLNMTRLKDTDLFTNETRWAIKSVEVLNFVQHTQVQNFFTSVESKAFVKAAELIGFVHQGSLGPTKGQAYRDNDRISVNDPVLASTIWESGLDKLFSDFKIRGKVAVGLNANIRFYRYKVGQRFGRHIDESVDLGERKRTYYTLLIYLSGSFEPKSETEQSSPQDSSEALVGGETVFYGSGNCVVAEVPPGEGMALLHIHGDRCMLHEARNVIKGVNFWLIDDRKHPAKLFVKNP
ncbi:2-oxoglutarate (2OG) and Fe(II)-dependent oxygenase superfamily protein [Actinidia rufa]|uniref:2-oxoglutarate (2OG) and Fe(II)-dependent oxygenase superfamily protein n=1 Tax=Actinidia rufa TaxID=165716 RepID=A0A7J0EAN9_9ERIC|nr:2-oxoglutarate (2OG) and Fe(II)-dependent oxygenase superfamily protein [Actinidia rufa]